MRVIIISSHRQFGNSRLILSEVPDIKRGFDVKKGLKRVGHLAASRPDRLVVEAAAIGYAGKKVSEIASKDKRKPHNC